MLVFIEKYNGEFRCANTYAAYYGFDSLGCEIKFFQGMFTSDQPFTKETPVVGSISVVQKALIQVGSKLPAPLDYPEQIISYLNRDVKVCTFGEIRNSNSVVFAKPFEDHKKFTGQVFNSYYNTENLEDELKVWISDPCEFEVEYRCFIHKGEIVGIHYYKGDFTKYIDVSVVESCVKTYKDAPIAYSADFGLINGKTSLVEINDSYSLGCYGLPSIKYAKMISDRWKEICGV